MTNVETIRRLRNRANAKRGTAIEDLAADDLRSRGYRMVARIETGWRVVRQGGRITGAFPIAKVAGDIHAVCPQGLSVLAEVKSRPKSLPWSALEAHQVDRLNEHAALSPHTFLFWHNSATGALTRHLWPIAGFGPGRSLPVKESG